MSEALSDFLGFIITILIFAFVSYVNFRAKKASPPPLPPRREAVDQILREIDESFRPKRPPALPKEPSTVRVYEETEGVAARHLKEAEFHLDLSSDLISKEAEAAYAEREMGDVRVKSLLKGGSLREAILLTEILGAPRGA